MVRPDVVWFGETLDPEILEAAVSACRSCDLLLVVGTSAVVHPAASLAPLAKGAGAKVVEINLEPTPNTGLTDFSLLGPAGEILPRLIRVEGG
jgi:NAD-dependent deacetylase